MSATELNCLRFPKCNTEGRDDDAHSDVSLCDFLPAHVRATNSFTRGYPLEHCTSTFSTPRYFGADHDEELGCRSMSSASVTSEASLCDHLPIDVVALNHRGTMHWSSEGGWQRDEDDAGFGSSTSSTPRCLGVDHEEELCRAEADSVTSETSLCDHLPIHVVALNHRGTMHWSSEGGWQMEEEVLSSDSDPHSSSSSLLDFFPTHADKRIAGSGSTSAPTEPFHVDVALDEDKDAVQSDSDSEASLCDFLPPHAIALNCEHRSQAGSDKAAEIERHDLPRELYLCENDSRFVSSASAYSQESDEHLPSGTGEVAGRPLAISFSSECSERPQSGILRALRRASLTSPLGSMRQTLGAMRQTLGGSRSCSGLVEDLNLGEREELDQNDRRVLNLPATLPFTDREVTMTMSVNDFRKEIMHPRMVFSKTTKISFSTSPEDVNENSAEDQCAVCLDQFCHGDELRVFPCSHRYHTMCIDVWLVENRLCPVCRNDPLLADSPGPLRQNLAHSQMGLMAL